MLNCFNKQGSTVSMAALDIPETFDKVNHYILFSKLLDHRIPVCMIKVLMCWYGKYNGWQNSMWHVFMTQSSDRHGRRHLSCCCCCHFCGMYPAGGTTQFTLYTCGVHRVLQPAAEVTQLFTFGFSTWKFCFLFLYSLLLVIQSRKLGP